MKKTVRRIVVLALIIAGIFGCNRYMHGNLKIDRELVSDENLNLLADNWEKLTDSKPRETNLPGWIGIEIEGSQTNHTLVTCWVNIGEDTGSSPYKADSATYDRNGLMDMLDAHAAKQEIRPFGESFNEIFVSNSRIAILFWEFEGKANADTFETWFRDQLEIAQS